MTTVLHHQRGRGCPTVQISKRNGLRLASYRRRLHREKRALARLIAQFRQACFAIARQRRKVERLQKQIRRLEP
jgi:hypothetical protein